MIKSVQQLANEFPAETFFGDAEHAPTACAICGMKPVVHMMTNAITTKPNYGFCELHKGAFALTSATIRGKNNTFLIYSPRQLEELNKQLEKE